MIIFGSRSPVVVNILMAEEQKDKNFVMSKEENNCFMKVRMSVVESWGGGELAVMLFEITEE